MLLKFLISRLHSFRYAFAGLGYLLRTQKNTWVHSVATICVVAMAAWLRLGRLEWAVLILAIGAVWLSEALNTAIESVVDLASPDLHPLAKAGKDAGAAAVLIAAIASVVIGLLVLGPPLWLRLTGL